MASAPASSPHSLLSPQSGAPQALQSQLNRLTRRRNSVVLGRHILRALVPGVWASAIGITLYKTHIIPDAPVWLPALALGACSLWGLRNGLRARGGTFRAARDADATLGLKDSLGSALSFVAPDSVGSNRAAPAPKTPLERVKRAILGRNETFHAAPHALETTLVPALVADAAGRAQALDPRRVYSWKFDRTAKAFAVGTVFLVGSFFVPDFPILASKKEVAERAAIMKSGERLAVLSKDVRKRQDPTDAQVAQLNKRLEKLGLKMARGRMSKRAALTEIGALKQQLQKAQQQQPPRNQNPPQQGGLPQIPEAIKRAPMQSQAGQKVQQDLQNNKSQDAARELDKLADKLEKGQLSQKEKEQAAKDLEEVARQLRQQGGQANEQAAQQLEQAAKQLRQQDQSQGQQGQQQQGQQGGQQQQGNKQGQQDQQGQQQQQGKQGQQGQQQQQGQQGGQQQGQQGQQQQSQQGQGQQQGQKGQQQQSGQQGQGQQGQKNGQSQSGQQGQQQQGQQGQGQSQSQNGQNQNQQGGKQGSQSGQQGQSQGGQQGQQGGQSGGGGQQDGQGQQSQGQSNASGALRDMANSLRQGAGSGGGGSDLRNMMNNLRQAENGTNGGSASGKGMVNPKMGSGQCPGGDCRGLATPGKDLMASDPHGAVGGGPGLGPRSNAQGSNSGGGVSKVKSRRTGDHRRYEDVWSSSLPKPHSKVDRVKGKWGGSGEVEQLPTRGDGKGGQAHTPYYNVYESYKRDAEDAVGRESVPPAYKAPVKDYFESIKP